MENLVEVRLAGLQALQSYCEDIVDQDVANPDNEDALDTQDFWCRVGGALRHYDLMIGPYSSEDSNFLRDLYETLEYGTEVSEIKRELIPVIAHLEKMIDADVDLKHSVC